MSLKVSPMSPAEEHLPDCWHRERDRQCLRIELNSGESFLFRYQQLLGVHHLRSTDSEALTISFSTHVVVLSGRNLSEITVALEDLAVGWIRFVPGRYENAAELEGALMTGIEVKTAE